MPSSNASTAEPPPAPPPQRVLDKLRAERDAISVTEAEARAEARRAAELAEVERMRARHQDDMAQPVPPMDAADDAAADAAADAAGDEPSKKRKYRGGKKRAKPAIEAMNRLVAEGRADEIRPSQLACDLGFVDEARRPPRGPHPETRVTAEECASPPRRGRPELRRAQSARGPRDRSPGRPQKGRGRYWGEDVRDASPRVARGKGGAARDAARRGKGDAAPDAAPRISGSGRRINAP